jgi:ribose transport system substrate-binding protein
MRKKGGSESFPAGLIDRWAINEWENTMARDTFGSPGRHLHRRDLLRWLGVGGAAITAASHGLRLPAVGAQEATPDVTEIDLTQLSVETFYVEPSPEFAEQQWVFGFSNASETNTWRSALREAIEQGAAAYPNVELRITDANDSPSKQLSDLEDLLANGSNGLIIGAATTDVANSVLERTQEEGIPVIIVDRLVASDKYTTFVTSDNKVMATTTLTYLCDLADGEGKIAIVEGIPGAGPAVERNAAYDEVLANFPDLEVVRQAGDWSRASGQRVIENIITANPDLKGIHFDGGEMALGGIQALRAAGITDDDMKAGAPYLTGMDGYNGWLGAIEQGIGQITMLHPPRVHGWVSVQTLVQALMGEELPKLTSLAPYQAIVRPDNAASFYAADEPDDYWSL